MWHGSDAESPAPALAGVVAADQAAALQGTAVSLQTQGGLARQGGRAGIHRTFTEHAPELWEAKPMGGRESSPGRAGQPHLTSPHPHL